jgi:ATPase family associated with various cellular activities (AAA)
MATSTPFTSLEADLADLARLAASGSVDDVRLFLARLVRKYRTSNPELSRRLDASLASTRGRAATSGVLRRRAEMSEPPAAPGSSVSQDGSALPHDRDSGLELLRRFDDPPGLAQPLLPAGLLTDIDQLIRERKSVDLLLERGIMPSRTVILVGPPGVGKTLTARYIAAQLGQPLLLLDLSAVMSSLLGKSGVNLRAALDYAKQRRSVLLLDEIDSIAKSRADSADVGELKRLVTVILQEVDHWPADSLLLGATNHPELIDHALWRRFDIELKFPMPSVDATEAAVRRFLGSELKVFSQWVELLAKSLQSRSLSDVERAVLRLRRAYALELSTPEDSVRDLARSVSPGQSHTERLATAIELARSGAMSHLEISQLTGVSRDTLRKHAGPSHRLGRGYKSPVRA